MKYLKKFETIQTKSIENKDLIKNYVYEFLKPTYDELIKKMNCDHVWIDNHGTSYNQCSICGFTLTTSFDNGKLEKLIFKQKLIDKGHNDESISNLLKYK